MSKENVEIVRELLTRWERGDYDTVEAFDPRVEFTRTGGGSDVLGYATESRGIDGLLAAMAAWTDEWSDVRVAAESYSEVGDRVLVHMRHSAVGKSSGARLDHLDAWVFSLRDGRIVRWDAYWDPVEARRALGLQEQALPQENVEIVRTLIGRWNAGDRDLERSSQHVDPAVELEGPLSSLAGELYRGYAGIERWMGDLDQQFAEWQIKVDDLRQVGDAVVAIFTVNARGRASGAPLEFDASALFNFGTDHRLIRAHLYRDVGGALKAVGLEE